MVDSPVMRIVGTLFSNSLVPGKRKGNVMPYVLRSQTCCTQSGFMPISPLPSEFVENVNSFSSVDESTLFRLTAAVRFGRDHFHCARSKLPTNGSLKCHGMCVPLNVSRWF